MKKSKETAPIQWTRRVSNLCLGAGIALVVCIAILLFISWGILAGWLPQDMDYQAMVTGCLLGCFIGGRYAVVRCGTRSLFIGLGVGVIFFLLLILMGILFYQEVSLENGGIGLLAGGLCGGTLAGIIGKINYKKAKKSYR